MLTVNGSGALAAGPYFQETPDPFDSLASDARPEPRIRVRKLTAPSPRRSRQSIQMVSCGQPLEFRCLLPEHLGEAQALLFEKDAVGRVSLLSQPGLLGADIWYSHAVVVPRPEIHPHDSTSAGWVALTQPGLSTLIMVCCHDRSVRFDKLPFFEMAFEYSGYLSIPTIDIGDLEQVRRRLLQLAPSAWAVMTGTVRVR